jgi:outer membrane lipoprotein carrier protein
MRRVLLAALALAASGLAFAGAGRDALDRFLRDLDTLKASFDQTVLDTERSRSGIMHGMFLLDRPGRFRWDYLAPAKQTILADGRYIWFIEEDLDQVTQHLQSFALKDTPAAFLTDQAEVDEDFEVTELGEDGGLQWVELTPRDADSDLQRVRLAIAGNELRRLELYDNFGQISRFRFFDIQRNVPIDPNLFVYEHEDDWDVLKSY